MDATLSGIVRKRNREETLGSARKGGSGQQNLREPGTQKHREEICGSQGCAPPLKGTTPTEKEWGTAVRGLVKVRTEELPEVLRKSKLQCVLRHRYGDDKYSVVSVGGNRERALEQAHEVDRYSFGMVPRGKAYALRVLKEDVQTVNALLNSELTEIVGEEIMVANRSEGDIYVITNVSKHLNGIRLASALKRGPLKWSVRPEGYPDRRNAAYNLHKVFALEPPKRNCMRINDAATGTSSLIRIVPLADTLKTNGKGFSGMMQLSTADVGILKEWLRGGEKWADAEDQKEEEPEWMTEPELWEMDYEGDPEDPDTECRRKANQNKVEGAWARRERAADLKNARTGNNVGQNTDKHEQHRQQQPGGRWPRCASPAGHNRRGNEEREAAAERAAHEARATEEARKATPTTTAQREE